MPLSVFASYASENAEVSLVLKTIKFRSRAEIESNDTNICC